MTEQKEAHVNCWEFRYIQTYQQQNLLTEERNLGEWKPLYDILRYSQIQRAWCTSGIDLHCLLIFVLSTVSRLSYTIRSWKQSVHS